VGNVSDWGQVGAIGDNGNDVWDLRTRGTDFGSFLFQVATVSSCGKVDTQAVQFGGNGGNKPEMV